MSQDIYNTINPSTTSGTQLAALLVSFKDAVVSGFSGTSRPPNLKSGGYWIDTTNEATPNFYWKYMIYDGAEDIEVFRINVNTNKVSIAGTDNLFEISKVSADAVGPIAKFIKQRIASSGQVISGDVIGEIQFIGRGSDASNPIVGRIRSIAKESQTATATGSDLVFEAVTSATNILSEVMRLIDGKLGVGTSSPSAKIHADGVGGIKSSLTADTANPALLVVEKSRIAGTKATQSLDDIGEIDFNTTDSLGAQVTSAKVKATATQAHTGIARGTKLTVATTDDGTATTSDKVIIGSEVESIVRLKMNALQLVGQTVATSATIAQLSATKAIVEFTGSIVTSVQGISATQASKVILLHNLSTADVTVEHENGTATAVDRIKLPYGTAITIPPQSSLELFYSVTDSRWKLKSGSGSGSGGSGSAGKNYASLLYAGNSVAGITTYNDAGAASGSSTGTFVDELGDVINIAGHGFTSGQLVFYQAIGTAIGGLTSGSYYYVWVLNTNSFGLATTRTAAIAGTPLIDLTSDGSGAHDFTSLLFPNDGVGGTVAGLTTSLNTTTPLRGTSSQKFSKDAANRQGMGWSYDIKMDRADYEGGKPVEVRFKYKTSANYVSGDLKLYVYDKDGNVLSTSIEGSPIPKANNTTSMSILFYPNSANDDYRIIFHTATSAALAWDFDFVDITVGSAASLAGSIIGEPFRYTPTLTTTGTAGAFGPITRNDMWAQRVGDSLEIHWDFSQSGAGTAGTGAYLLNLPSGLQIDTSKRDVGSGQARGILGVATWANLGLAQQFQGQAQIFDSTRFTFQFLNTAGAVGTVVAWGATELSLSFTGITNMSAKIKVPILGWSSTNTVTTTELAISPIKVDVFKMNNTQSIATGGEVQIVGWTSKLSDETSSFDLTSGTFTAPKSARYQFSGGIGTLTTTGNTPRVLIMYKNGANFRTVSGIGSAPGTQMVCPIAQEVDLLKGETIRFHLFQGSGAAINNFDCNIQIREMVNFSVVGVGGNSFEIVNTTSLTKTPGASARFLAITGSNLSLSAGVWELNAQVYFSTSGGTPGYQLVLAEWRGAIGSDTSADVAFIESLTGVTVLSAQTPGIGSRIDFTPNAAQSVSLAAQTIIVKLSQAQSIWMVPYVQLATPANARVTVYATAKRLQ